MSVLTKEKKPRRTIKDAAGSQNRRFVATTDSPSSWSAAVSPEGAVEALRGEGWVSPTAPIYIYELVAIYVVPDERRELPRTEWEEYF
jgi:hypothetical protein